MKGLFNRLLNDRRRIKLWMIVVPMLFGATFVVWFINENYQHFLPQLFYFSLPTLAGFAIVAVLTPAMLIVAKKTNALDHPSERKTQAEPIPLLGGLAIYLGLMIVSMFYQPWPEELRSILIGGSILLILGTIDDIHPLSSVVRLVGQLAAALIVMSSGLVVSFMPEVWWGDAVGAIITIVWILGIANALNFADGVDGLAAGISIIASLFFFLITLHIKQYEISFLTSVMMGCAGGFLVYNFKPAKIYLGDGGSTFLGFLLACVALYGGWSDKGPIIALGIPTLILGVLIFDMCYITVSRVKNGLVKNVKEWLDFTGKDHFHHRLMHLGFREQDAVIFIYIICIILGLSALVLENVRTSFPVVILCLQAALIFMNITFLMLVGRKLYLPKNVLEKVMPNSAVLQNTGEEFISGNMLKRLLEEQSQADVSLDAVGRPEDKILKETEKV